MIEAFKNLAKGAFTESANDLKSVSEVVSILCYIFVLVVIKTVIIYPVWRCKRPLRILSKGNGQKIDFIKINDLRFLKFKQIFTIIDNSRPRIHWKTILFIKL